MPVRVVCKFCILGGIQVGQLHLQANLLGILCWAGCKLAAWFTTRGNMNKLKQIVSVLIGD